MTEQLIFDEDPLFRIRRIWHRDEEQIVVKAQQDVERLIEGNKEMYNNVDERARFTPVNHPSTLGASLVARLPNTVYFDLVRRGIWDDEEKRAAWLNDPANKDFRTRPGRI